MYAVISNGGKQYRVIPGMELALESIAGEVGDKIKIDQVLLVADGETITAGSPHVDKASVGIEILSHGRQKKIKIIKFRRRKHHMKRQGHRQDFTKVRVIDITAAGKTTTAEAVAKKAAPKVAKETVDKAPAKKATAPKKTDAAAKPAKAKPAKVSQKSEE